MNEPALLSALHQTLYTIMIAVSIITVPTLIVGVLISIVQAATQINEMTMTFIPKLIVMFIVLLILAPWFMDQLVSMTHTMLFNLPTYLR